MKTSIRGLNRRGFLGLGLLMASAMTVAVPEYAAAADKLDDIIAAAKKEGHVVWYDSLPRNQGEAILAEFHKAYPFIKADYLEVPGAEKVARITQESMAGGPTADVTLDGAAAAMRQQEQGFLLPVDWKGLGIDLSPQRTPNEYLIAITAPLFGVLYNTNKVKPNDVPKTYAELVDPKWQGRIGTWARANGFATMLAAWGEDKTTDYVKKLAALHPRLYRSTYSIAESIGAGEIDLAFTIYHTAVPTMEKGAPVKWQWLEPIPVTPLYGYLLKEGRNHAAGKLLLMWLGSAKGAIVYEQVSSRGNPFVPETKTAKMLAGKKISMFDAQTEVKKADWVNKLETKFGHILQGR